MSKAASDRFTMFVAKMDRGYDHHAPDGLGSYKVKICPVIVLKKLPSNLLKVERCDGSDYRSTMNPEQLFQSEFDAVDNLTEQVQQSFDDAAKQLRLAKEVRRSLLAKKKVTKKTAARSAK